MQWPLETLLLMLQHFVILHKSHIVIAAIFSKGENRLKRLVYLISEST